jgi:hypothetical protein
VQGSWQQNAFHMVPSTGGDRYVLYLEEHIVRGSAGKEGLDLAHQARREGGCMD